MKIDNDTMREILESVRGGITTEVARNRSNQQELSKQRRCRKQNDGGGSRK